MTFRIIKYENDTYQIQKRTFGTWATGMGYLDQLFMSVRSAEEAIRKYERANRFVEVKRVEVGELGEQV